MRSNLGHSTHIHLRKIQEKNSTKECSELLGLSKLKNTLHLLGVDDFKNIISL